MALVSCHSYRLASGSQAMDSLNIHRQVYLSESFARPDTVRMDIPIMQLTTLPALAGYTTKSGRARTEVRFRHDTVMILTTCDSLALMNYALSEEISRLQKDSTYKSKSVVPINTGLTWKYSGIIALVSLIIGLAFPSFIKLLKH